MQILEWGRKTTDILRLGKTSVEGQWNDPTIPRVSWQGKDCKREMVSDGELKVLLKWSRDKAKFKTRKELCKKFLFQLLSILLEQPIQM